MKKFTLSILFFFFSIISTVYSINDLSVKDNSGWGSSPGYIEKTTLVVEPFGSHVEQSLYLEYSERNQFSSDLLEIVHRFELPTDAVVQDMWLWIGDSVMQAQMFDTWSARSVYDSIVATKYDPAFLTKTGSQYELKIYPLKSGSRRKVKISYTVPTTWLGEKASTQLPLKLLQSNNSETKPLEILFRTQKDVWGIPKIVEDTTLQFSPLLDTLIYSYQSLVIDDITNFSSLNLSFNTTFENGYLVNGYHDLNDETYFQFGFLPDQLFNVSADSSSDKVLISLDFSGSFKKNFSERLPIYEELMKNSLKENDSFKLLVSGKEKIIDYTDAYLPATTSNIEGVFTEFTNSELYNELNEFGKKSVLYCDTQAKHNWYFDGLSELAEVKKLTDISDALNLITKYDVVAAYEHGHDNVISQDMANQVIEKLDTLFTNGGRFVTYYDYNRVGKEKLGTHYIDGLRVKRQETGALTLYRNDEGNIGINFPESYTRNAAYLLDFDDPDVKIELMDKNGDAAVISKKIGNGLIIVSGIWGNKDDNAIKEIISIPILGLNESSTPFTLNSTFEEIYSQYQSNSFSKVILLSDSDSLISVSDSKDIINNYLNSFGETVPKFNTINVLSNESFTPVYLTDNLIEYYGSGYLLKELASQTGGLNLEKSHYDWNYITSVLNPYSTPSIDALDIDVAVDDNTGTLLDLREIGASVDPNKPRFFLGKSDAKLDLKFNVTCRFEETTSDSIRIIEYLVPYDTSSSNKMVALMLGNEEIKDLFNDPPIDTAKIVELSIYYNLLTDYTALLALEPNDEFHFMKDPLDEGDLTDVEDVEEVTDSTFITTYPNPFNGRANFKFNIKAPSNVKAVIYNSLGQKVFELANDQNVNGVKLYSWNAKNSFGSTVSSGFYILRAVITDNQTKETEIITQKLMYLK